MPLSKPFKAIGEAFGKAKTALFGAGDTGKALKDTTGKMGGVIDEDESNCSGIIQSIRSTR